jgi:hypothetical protein
MLNYILRTIYHNSNMFRYMLIILSIKHLLKNIDKPLLNTSTFVHNISASILNFICSNVELLLES